MCNCNACNTCGCNCGCGICNCISRAIRNLFDASALCNGCGGCNCGCGCGGRRGSRSGCCGERRQNDCCDRRHNGCGCGDYDDYYARQYALYPYGTTTRCGCGCNN